jgi:hypothetical protein
MKDYLAFVIVVGGIYLMYAGSMFFIKIVGQN